MDHTNDSLIKAFYHDGYRLGMQAVEAGLGKDTLFAALAEMHRQIDGLIGQLLDFARSRGQGVDCQKGCQWCCYQPVFALDYELDYLAGFVEKHFQEKTRQAVKKKAEEKVRKLAGLKGDDLLDAKHPCPLLNEEGACMAYPARPVACRIYLSSKLETCTTFYRDPGDKSSYPALLDFPMRAGRMMNEGFKAALKTKGIVAKEFRIEEGIGVSNSDIQPGS